MGKKILPAVGIHVCVWLSFDGFRIDKVRFVWNVKFFEDNDHLYCHCHSIIVAITDICNYSLSKGWAH